MKLKNIIKLFSWAIILIIVVGMLSSGCTEEEDNTIYTLEQLNSSEYVILVDPGSAASISAEKYYSNATIKEAPSATDAYMAMQEGKADAFVYGKVYMQHAIASGELKNLSVMDGYIDIADVAAGINPNREDLVKPINEFIQQIQEDGTLDDMYNRWVISANEVMPDIQKAENPAGTLRFVTCGTVVPMSYISNGEPSGFDVEFIKRLALFLNVDYTLEVMDFDAMITSLQTDRGDVAVSNLNITDERREVIKFSDPYMTSETGVMVNTDRLESVEDIKKISDIRKKRVGYIAGSSYEEEIMKRFSDCTFTAYITQSELIEALKNNKIDLFVTDGLLANAMVRETDGIKKLDERLTTDRYGIMLNKSNTSLLNEINDILEQFRLDGTLLQLENEWLKGETGTIDGLSEGVNGVLRVAVSADTEPYAYLSDGDIVGYDVELICKIAQALGYTPEITNYQFSGLFNTLVSNKADVAVGCLTYTEERAEAFLFSNPIFTDGAAAVTLDRSAEELTILESIVNSIEKTLIREERWKLILNGLIVTAVISVLTLICGSVLGFFFSFMLRSKNKSLSCIAGIISEILDGVPILIVLMMLYYVVFVKTSVSAVLIGAIGFTLNFANSVAGTLNVGIDAVPKGEIEAAEAMGYSRFNVFAKIIFPQAANHMFSAYSGSVIGMIKETSVVGYISVQDLTQATELIRSRTFEAFFPLVLSAVIYFVIAKLFIAVLASIAKRIDPKHKKRAVKGVKIR